MTNIIEQQGLLKGLPDNRLALLMQNPSNDIPPFLVAAEAQRRQSVRQQYAGAQPNESVVDSLTKQMASVPQNVQAPMQTPPRMPPPMQMPQQAGIGAIRQGMAGGGMAQRYNVGALVTPTVDSVAEGYFQDPMGTPSTADEAGSFTNPFSGLGGYIYEGLQNLTHSPVPRWETEEQINKRWAEEHPTGMSEADRQAELKTLKNRIPRNTANDPGKKDTSPTNQEATTPDYEALPPEYRDRLKAIMGAGEPSNWENAQKWFAMSAQLMNPDANLMQSLANAGSVYSAAEADQARSKREADIALQKALLDWDVGEFTSKRDFNQSMAAAKAAAEQKMLERMTPTAGNVMDYYTAQIKAASADLADIDANMELTDAQKLAAKEDIQKRIDAFAAQASMLMKNSGYNTAGAVTQDQLNAVTGQ